jgi:hypothetical protein
MVMCVVAKSCCTAHGLHSVNSLLQGHSIGGSLGMLLAFMYRVRGVLQPHHLATIYTFGSPAVFCETGVPEQHQPNKPAQGAETQVHQPHTQALSPLTALTLEQVRPWPGRSTTTCSQQQVSA